MVAFRRSASDLSTWTFNRFVMTGPALFLLAYRVWCRVTSSVRRAKRLLFVPRHDAGVSVVQAIVDGHVGWVGGLVKICSWGHRG